MNGFELSKVHSYFSKMVPPVGRLGANQYSLLTDE